MTPLTQGQRVLAPIGGYLWYGRVLHVTDYQTAFVQLDGLNKMGQFAAPSLETIKDTESQDGEKNQCLS